MKKRATWLSLGALVVFSLLITVGSVEAQTSSRKNVQASSLSVAENQAGVNYHSSFASAEFAFNGSVIVQGAPYSATNIIETTQILSDGRRVVRRMAGRVYRDSEGRTRHECIRDATRGEATAGAPMIYDAATGAIYILNPQRRNALQLSLPHAGATPRQAKIITPQTPPENQLEVAGGAVSLGTTMIEGIMAEGVRTTRLIPVGEIGNKEPIKVVYERWYSPELRGNILIKCTDTRFGEAVYRLTNIDRSEPARELFAIPTGYRVEPARFDQSTRTIKSHYVK